MRTAQKVNALVTIHYHPESHLKPTSTRAQVKSQIQEWRIDHDQSALGHQHLSPLYGVPPPRDAVLACRQRNARQRRCRPPRPAQRRRLQKHGMEQRVVHQPVCATVPGADVWAQIEKWDSFYPTRNFWNIDDGATFQIDGNFGVTSGVTEVLLQSHLRRPPSAGTFKEECSDGRGEAARSMGSGREES
ncbi:uncharacterized protein BJX67DRAFT_141491 [Aspergillus lucknowensis]|uniref:Glycosyl hydrolase family 95 catalytic domain-containing protein n=1 Tax=Aspergillus lucknowensis TaxID=176173 RepID=A0ABR4LP15_9EURO